MTGHQEQVDKKEEASILAKLSLLARMRQLHEWTVFGTKEAEAEEAEELRIDSGTADAPDKETD